MDRPLKSYRKKAVVKSSTILESTEEGKDSTGSKVECCSRTIHLLFPLIRILGENSKNLLQS
ncbi:MAG: hypothetical protein AYK18_05720 [Theionarchaea archaeon DG-70]|nr:MAG: hypothetical protein AYK18_05720 [Theionarchaea archaeon DG-70]